MAKQLLVETRLPSPLVLVEGAKGKNVHPGCLGTLRGPCADYKNPTRNGNFYSRKLWENVFANELVKESLEDRVLIGELDHPGDRLETKATLSAIVMTGYDFDDENQLVMGDFDILDTPNGRILKSLLDYGCKIGVSSRGEGDVETIEGVNHVDEEGYDFVAFDAVTLPAVKKAKPSLSESLKRKGLKESLQEQIDSATTKMELELIKNVIKTTEMPELDSLIESIDIKSNEIEGTNGSSNLVGDLESSTREIGRLKEENKKLSLDLTNSKKRLQRFVVARSKLAESNSQLETEHKQSLRENQALDLECCDLRLQCSAESRKVESLEEELERAQRTIKKLQSSLEINCSQLAESQDRVKSLEESLEKSQQSCHAKIKAAKELRKKNESLTQELEQSKAALAESRKKEKSAKSSLKESKRMNKASLISYATSAAQSKGINPERVTRSLREGMTVKDIDKIVQDEVDSIGRYGKLQMTSDPILESLARNAQVSVKSGKSPELSPEEQGSMDFARQVFNQR